MRVEVEPDVVVEVLDRPSDAGSDAPALLMLHGFGGSPLDFEDHVDALATTHRVIRFFHRGHGPSSRPDDLQAYSFDRLALDALAVADASNVEQFVLYGWSMGGMVARRIVLRAPHRVERLILQDTTPGPVPGYDAAIMEIAIEVALRDGMGALKSLLDAVQPLVTPAYLRLLATKPGYGEYLDGRFWSMSSESWGGLGREIAHQPDETARLRSVTVPTLVIVGELDDSFIPGSQAIADAVPGAQLVEIPDAGHSPQFENPEVWIKVMQEFLA